MKRLDMFPFNPSLQIDKYEGFKTNVGGFITSIIAIGIILSCFAFSRELFNRTNPFILDSLNFDPAPSLSKSSLSFFFAPMLIGGFTIPESEKLLNMYLEMVSTDNTLKDEDLTVFVRFPISKCLNSKLFNDTSKNISSFMIGDINNYYCESSEDYSDLRELYGSLGNPKFTVWNLMVEACVNSTLNDFSCKSNDEIKLALNAFYFHLGITNILIDSFDYSLPLKPTFYSRLMRVSGFNYRNDIIYHTPITYSTDSGFILEDISSLSSFQISRVESDSLYSEQPANILKITLTIENLRLKILRSYTKVQTITASIGGFAKFVVIVLGYINKRINEFYFYKYMARTSAPLQTKLYCQTMNIDLVKKTVPVLEDNSTIRIKELTQIAKSTIVSKPQDLALLNNYSPKLNLKFSDVCSFIVYCNLSKHKSKLSLIKEAFNNYFTIENVILSASRVTEILGR